MTQSISVALLVCTVVSVIFALPQAFDDVKLENSEGHDVIDGNCTRRNESDLVYHEYIHKTRIPFFKRSETVEWFGDEVIYCIRAINQKSDEKGGHGNVTKGGFRHSFVTLKMQSGSGHGLEFNVTIYANSTGPIRSNNKH